ncbi:Fc.00g112820.m01.CDS01 [Cosmosporella sp. VM-42]
MKWLSASGLAATAALLLETASAQTWSSCNPLQSTQCPADTALGMTINVDFTQGAVNSFAASGSPTYGQDGASFSVHQGGDAPQLNSLFYIMFGRVDITMKAAPGAGIVSSLVLQSDTLDEIDIEWLGAAPDQIQSNYFGKGQTTTYNRGQFHDVAGTQANYITYTIEWTKDQILWIAGGTVVRTLNANEAEAGQYPQTPMQVKFGAWAGGDPNFNAPGTVTWAKGPTDYSAGPFTMAVKNVAISDYSTGKEYRYTDTSGSWQSIQAVDGEVNGNADGSKSPTVVATAAGAAATGTNANFEVPRGGIAKDGSSATATQTGWPWVADASPTEGTIPSGWMMNNEGKIVRNGSPLVQVSYMTLVLALFSVGVMTMFGRL